MLWQRPARCYSKAVNPERTDVALLLLLDLPGLS